MLLLAGDVGGTKVLLQLLKVHSDGSEECLGEQRYLCNQFESLEAILVEFLTKHQVAMHTNQVEVIEQACFGLPGPVSGRTVLLTNLPWSVNADHIEQACSIKNVVLVNDFYAAANGIRVLGASQVEALHFPSHLTDSTPPNSHRLVVGAGTGLGVAPVFYNGQAYQPLASEGGHFDFAPISMTQQLILQWLWRQWDHVSYERLLSGPGLETLYAFFELTHCPTSYAAASDNGHTSQNLKKAWLSMAQTTHIGSIIATSVHGSHHGLPQNKVSAEQIHQAASRGEPIAVKALTEFVTIYGAYIGAAALIWHAPGGIYLAGGIASKIRDWMRQPYFLTAFLEKGRMSKLVETMPVFLVTDPALGLKGAMQHNRQLLNLI